MMITMPTFNRGDVVLVLFPNSDLRTAKTRPALIVQADNLNTDFPQVVVAMLSSKTFRANHPSRILVEIDSKVGENSGLLSDSVVMTDNIATIAKIGVDRVIGGITDGCHRRSPKTHSWSLSNQPSKVLRKNFG